MSQYVVTPTKAFTAGAAIARKILVKISSGKLAVAGLAEQAIGVIEEAAFADGDIRAVRLLSAQGTIQCTAAGAFSAGATVYGRALGKVDDVSTSSAIKVGVAMEDAGAAGDIVEVMPC